jgi:tRNA 2-thiouridine synthesizing protein A
VPYRVDARGLSCPQPVVMTKKALEAMGLGAKSKALRGSEVSDASGPLEAIDVLVDNRTAMENVSRFARHSGYDADVETVKEGDDCYIVRICVRRRAQHGRP